MIDPRAAGPHTLAALRSLRRLLERGSLLVRTAATVTIFSPDGTKPTDVGKEEEEEEEVVDEEAVVILPRDHERRHPFVAALEPLARGVLSCRFEQTDAGADEAVEMAIADLLGLLVDLDASVASEISSSSDEAVPAEAAKKSGAAVKSNFRGRIRPETIAESFRSVFVTRYTFHHSPALCLRFEDVLTNMIRSSFADVRYDVGPKGRSSSSAAAAALILEFLMDQMTDSGSRKGKGGFGDDSAVNDGGSGVLEEAEAAASRDGTRLLCLKLIRACLATGWGKEGGEEDYHWNGIDGEEKEGEDVFVMGPLWGDDPDRATLLRLISDDLCLSLITMGQSIWSHHSAFPSSGTKSSSSGSGSSRPGSSVPMSPDVLGEICSTLSALWNVPTLRTRLVPQFEAVFAGFYQRALSLLGRLPDPTDGAGFHANRLFDAEVEIILEGLVDLLCLQDDDSGDDRRGGTGGGGGRKRSTLETLFAAYDVSPHSSDVASGLVVELCRCCGGSVGEDGKPLVASVLGETPGVLKTGSGGAVAPSLQSKRGSFASNQSGLGSDAGSLLAPADEDPRPRRVPAHLVELCAEALAGCAGGVFQGSSATGLGLPGPDPSGGEGASLPEEDPVLTHPPPEKMHIAIEAVSRKGLTTLHLCQISPRYAKRRKRLTRRAAQLFNAKSSHGIKFLVTAGVLSSTEPVTPKDVASFLRSAIVVGLDKRAAGEYMGTIGKPPAAHKSPPVWERDWFHAAVLREYCESFHFAGQPLLDCLRTFLAAFRLPGEAQMIDRILQAFAESCGRNCREAGGCSVEGERGRRAARLFSPDEKRASDGAYLLSFSIIMLNTDLHNENIRADRKMIVEDFVRNNTDYGRDITDEGMGLPKEYLEGIYESIRTEQIRTEGEGADGVMTPDRWRDVLRGSAATATAKTTNQDGEVQVNYDDLRELVVENIWMPMLSAVGGFWGVTAGAGHSAGGLDSADLHHSGAHGVQGARLGMDLAVILLQGARDLGRPDIFRDIFETVCRYSGLLGAYGADVEDRTSDLVHSVKRQSAVAVAISAARDCGDYIGYQGWRCIWGLVFELRDLMVLGGARQSRQGLGYNLSLLAETDPDLLTESSRREFSVRLVKETLRATRAGASEDDGYGGGYYAGNSVRSALSAVGRALFGTDAPSSLSGERRLGGISTSGSTPDGRRFDVVQTVHGKEEQVLWDDMVASDDEDGYGDPDHSLNNSGGDVGEIIVPDRYSRLSSSVTSPGATFESRLLREDSLAHRGSEAQPVTGLETFEDTQAHHVSPRARIRRRLAALCDFSGLLRESRFLSMNGTRDMLRALSDIVREAQETRAAESAIATIGEDFGGVGKGGRDLDKNEYDDDGTAVTASSVAGSISNAPDGVDGASSTAAVADPYHPIFALSPASEAMAEVLICEIALQNRYRIGALWDVSLRGHYFGRLAGTGGSTGSLLGASPGPVPRQTGDDPELVPEASVSAPSSIDVAKDGEGIGATCHPLSNPGLEKCVTGLLRIAVHAVHCEEDVCSDVLSTLRVLHPPEGGAYRNCATVGLDCHLAEGLWRICRNVDSLKGVNRDGWDGLLGLVEWCAIRGEAVSAVRGGRSSGLGEDDPALQAFRSLHLILHAAELKGVVPFEVVVTVRALIRGGERQNCPKLSVAGLDLLLLLHSRLESLITGCAMRNSTEMRKDSFRGGVGGGESDKEAKDRQEVLATCWLPILEGMAEAAGKSRYPVRARVANSFD